MKKAIFAVVFVALVLCGAGVIAQEIDVTKWGEDGTRIRVMKEADADPQHFFNVVEKHITKEQGEAIYAELFPPASADEAAALIEEVKAKLKEAGRDDLAAKIESDSTKK